MQRISLLSVLTILLMVPFSLLAQPDGTNNGMELTYWNPTVGSLNGFGRDVFSGCDVDQDGKPEIIMTQYNYDAGSALVIYEVIGENMIEEVWNSGDLGAGTYESANRSVTVAPLDDTAGDEIITFLTTGWNSVLDNQGVIIFTWDGVNDNGFVEVARINHNTFSGHDTSSYRTEDLAVADFDDDGKNEIAWANWVGGSNRYASIYSIDGDLLTGFYTLNQEFYRSRYSLVPGGVGGSMTGTYYADLDNDGHSELWVGVYNSLGFAVIESDGPNSYADSADTYYADGLDVTDTYIIKGFVHGDIDGDGTNEIFMEGTHTGTVFLLKSDDVQDTIYITPLDWMDVGAFTTLNLGDLDHAGGGYDGLDIYSAGTSAGIVDYEYVGGALEDSASWMRYTFGRDTCAVDTFDMGDYDSLGYVISPSWQTHIPAADMDGDGIKELVTTYLVNGNTELSDSTSNDTPIPEANKKWLQVFEFGGDPSSISDRWQVITPEDYVLHQNYPNPFNPETTIEFVLPINKKISLTVYNALGQKVKTLIDNQELKAGSHTVNWDATNQVGHKVATGMYIYTLKYGNFSKNMKMMLVK